MAAMPPRSLRPPAWPEPRSAGIPVGQGSTGGVRTLPILQGCAWAGLLLWLWLRHQRDTLGAGRRPQSPEQCTQAWAEFGYGDIQRRGGCTWAVPPGATAGLAVPGGTAGARQSQKQQWFGFPRAQRSSRGALDESGRRESPLCSPSREGRPWKHIWWPWWPRSGQGPPGGLGWHSCSPLRASGWHRCPPGPRHSRARCQRLVEDTERVGEEGGGKLRSSSTATPTLLRRVNMQEAATHLLVRGLYFSMEFRLELPSLPPTA